MGHPVCGPPAWGCGGAGILASPPTRQVRAREWGTRRFVVGGPPADRRFVWSMIRWGVEAQSPTSKKRHVGHEV
jgi:hypothetical protein